MVGACFLDAMIGCLFIYTFLFMVYFLNARSTMLKLRGDAALSSDEKKQIMSMVLKQTLRFTGLFFVLRFFSDIIMGNYVSILYQIHGMTNASSNRIFLYETVYRLFINSALLYILYSRFDFAMYLKELKRYNRIKEHEELMKNDIGNHIEGHMMSLKSIVNVLKAKSDNLEKLKENMIQFLETEIIKNSQSETGEKFKNHAASQLRESMLFSMPLPSEDYREAKAWLYYCYVDTLVYCVGAMVILLVYGATGGAYSEVYGVVDVIWLVFYYLERTVQGYLAFMIISRSVNFGAEVRSGSTSTNQGFGINSSS